MGSLSFAEIVVIVLVILVVFGPNRLPELARKAGELMRTLRNASSSMSDALGVDYESTVEPIRSAKRDYDEIKTDLSKTFTDFGHQLEESVTPSGEVPRGSVDPDPADAMAGESPADGEPKSEAPDGDAADDDPTASS